MTNVETPSLSARRNNKTFGGVEQYYNTGTQREQHLSAKSVAFALGGEASGNRVFAPGPGHAKHDRSMSVILDSKAPGGFRVHSFAGDDWRDCRDHIKAALGIEDREPVQVREVTPQRDDKQTAALAQTIWRQCEPIRYTPAEAYLFSRKLNLDWDNHPDLKAHGALHFEGKRVPGLVALMRDAVTGEPTGIHRTFLTPDGKKLDRRMLGRAKGACVQLVPSDDVAYGLGIAEGIETALSMVQIGWGPMWACLTAGGIGSFPILGGIDALTVFADADEAGKKAARICGERWEAAGREVQLVLPHFNGGARHGN